MSAEHIHAPTRPRFELRLAALIFALIAVWFAWTPIARLGRETLSPVDALQRSPLLELDSHWHPGNPDRADVATSLHAAYAIDRESFARGELPTWDRFSGFGAPHLARPDSAPLSPFTWIHCLLALDRAALVEAIVKLFLAGFLSYGFLRALRLAPVACFFGANAFLFSGAILEQLARPRSAAVLALPAGLWVLESLARRIERDPPRGEITLRRLFSPAHAAALFVVVACGSAAGDPAAFACVALVLLAYGCARGWTVRRRIAQQVGGVSIAAIGAQLGLVACLAVCVCAVQLVPFAEYLGESAVLRDRLVHGAAALDRADWQYALFPNLLGDPAAPRALAAFAGLLTLFCALLAPLAVRGRRVLTFFTVAAAAWIVFTYDVFGALTLARSSPAFRLVAPESGLAVLHFALAASAAFFAHHVIERNLRRDVIAAAATLCAALTLLFVARAGASRLVFDTLSALPSAAERADLVRDSARHVFVTGAWFAAGAGLVAGAWLLSNRSLRLAAIVACTVLLAVIAAPARDVYTTAPNAFVFPKTAAVDEVASLSASHRLAFLGETPLPRCTAALYGIESLSNADGIGIDRVERLRGALFTGSADGTNLRWAARRGLHLFGIDRVLAPDSWIDVGTWTGFAAPDAGAEYLTSPLVPDAAIELDFRCPAERASAIRVCFETGGRPLLQNIGLEVVDRVTGEVIATRVIEPDFVHPNREARVFGVLPLPQLADWKTRQLRLSVRSNDGVTATAWSVVARRDWMHVMNLGLWRRDGVTAFPVELRHPDFTGFACRQFGRELRGSIVVDVAANAAAVREDGTVASYRVFDFADAAPAYRTVSRALAADDGNTSLDMVTAPAFDPVRTVVIEGLSRDQGADEHATNEPVAVTARDARTVRLRTTRATPGWLVTSQPWYPGWRATVNGVEKPILRANHAFQAVALDAGTSEIVLAYDPWSVRLGAWLSCAALAAIAAWIVISRGSGLSHDARAS